MKTSNPTLILLGEPTSNESTVLILPSFTGVFFFVFPHSLNRRQQMQKNQRTSHLKVRLFFCDFIHHHVTKRPLTICTGLSFQKKQPMSSSSWRPSKSSPPQWKQKMPTTSTLILNELLPDSIKAGEGADLHLQPCITSTRCKSERFLWLIRLCSVNCIYVNLSDWIIIVRYDAIRLSCIYEHFVYRCHWTNKPVPSNLLPNECNELFRLWEPFHTTKWNSGF